MSLDSFIEKNSKRNPNFKDVRSGNANSYGKEQN